MQDQQPFEAVFEEVPSGALLRLGPENLQVSWSCPALNEWCVGLGVLAEQTSAPSTGLVWREGVPAQLPPGPWFGGWAFDATRTWPGFPAERWFVPRVLAWWNGKVAVVAALGHHTTSTEVLRDRLRAVVEIEPTITVPTSRVSDDGAAAYCQVVDAAVAALDSARVERLQKLVVARRIQVDFDAAIPERRVLKALEAKNPSCRIFLLRGTDGSAFVGATPETLVEVQDSTVHTEALAGTAPIGQEAELMASAKDRSEHAFVVEGIREVLGRYCSSMTISDQPQLKKLARLVHLQTPMTAVLRPGATALELARALHPSPAVAGTPKAESIEWLKKNERFSRGWYAGVVASFSPQKLRAHVALRSALLTGSTAEVFVGAGVVQTSKTSAELAETDVKARAMMEGLGIDHG